MLTVGEVLKNKRKSLRKSLETVSSETKVQVRFLDAIENDDFSIFSDEVFLIGFIKIYAEYLDLDVDKILALYRRSNPEKKSTEERPIYSNKIDSTDTRRIPSPQFFGVLLLILFSFGIIFYIFLQIKKFQTPPTLTIYDPTEKETTTTENSIVVKGKTDEGVSIDINDTSVETDSTGYFEKSITLIEGSNLITVKAKKNTNNVLETIETRKVVYNAPKKEEEVVPAEPVVIENKITLRINNSETWVNLKVDGEEKINQIIQPSDYEYIINNSLEITTGKPSDTQLYYNGELVEWKNVDNVAYMSCNVTDNLINCN